MLLSGEIINSRFFVDGYSHKDERWRKYYVVTCLICNETFIVRSDKIPKMSHCKPRRDNQCKSKPTRMYKDIYKRMIARCYDNDHPAYKHYGGRGISVCDLWRFGDDKLTGFQHFRRDIGVRWDLGLTLDRINNNGNYEPGNVRWIRPHEQNKNKGRGE